MNFERFGFRGTSSWQPCAKNGNMIEHSATVLPISDEAMPVWLAFYSVFRTAFTTSSCISQYTGSKKYFSKTQSWFGQDFNNQLEGSLLFLLRGNWFSFRINIFFSSSVIISYCLAIIRQTITLSPDILSCCTPVQSASSRTSFASLKAF